jgi:sortase A
VRMVFTPRSLRTLRWISRILFAGGIATIAYCGFVLADTWTFQKRQRLQLDRLLTSFAGSPVSSESARMAAGGLIGRIEIPRLGVSAIVMEGTSNVTLRRAVGHISGTALPGDVGNVGISGHRDTFFRPLRNIRQNDIITLTTLLGEFRYRVISTRVVDPSDVAVLGPTGRDTLTLVTCYPFYFVGAAPDRFIVLAERAGNASRKKRPRVRNMVFVGDHPPQEASDRLEGSTNNATLKCFSAYCGHGTPIVLRALARKCCSWESGGVTP